MGEYPFKRRTLSSLNPPCRGIVLQGKYTFFDSTWIHLPSYRLEMEKGKAMFLARQLGHKFGVLPLTVAQRIDNARSEELAMWGERTLGFFRDCARKKRFSFGEQQKP